jgi:DHA1 family bicyclomycin/chloramphenicol resistance-like MFS transporter
MMDPKAQVRFLDRTTPPHIMTLVLMAGIAAMNMSAFLPSLPGMAVYFDTEYEVMQLSVSLYLAVNALLQLFIGPIADRFGRRITTLTCLSIFVVASIGCILATSVEVFLFFRMLQGVVAVGIVLSRAIVRDIVPQNEAASMIGYVTMGMALVPMVAPMIGGALDAAFDWHATFIFLLVGGVGVLALCWADQGETSLGSQMSFRDQFREYPELLRSKRFWGYVFSAAFASGAFFAFLGGAPWIASNIYGLSSFEAGIGFGAPAIGYAIGNGVSGRFSVRFGVNWMVRTGATIAVLGLSLATILAIAGLDNAYIFFGCCTFVGLGNGMVIPNASAGLLSVRPHLAGTASGLGSFFMIGGGAALSVIAGIVLKFGGGSLPLLLLMTTSVLFGLVSVLYVIKRENEITAI